MPNRWPSDGAPVGLYRAYSAWGGCCLGSRGGARTARSAPGCLVSRFQREARRAVMLRVVASLLSKCCTLNR